MSCSRRTPSTTSSIRRVSLILAAIGLVTHEVVVPVILQHLSGIASALLLWAATRRVSGSEWAGLVPAGIVLLDPDFIFLEHSIMSESWLVLGICVGLYATSGRLIGPSPGGAGRCSPAAAWRSQSPSAPRRCS